MTFRLVLLATLLPQIAWAAPQAKQTEAQVHNNQGNDLYGKGQLDAAIAEYREAIRLRPDNAEAHISLGAALEKKGDLKGAGNEYLEALRLDPKNAAAHVGMGNVLVLEDNDYLDGEIAEYQEALRLDPKNAKAHLGMGNSLQKFKKDEDGAIKEYREALFLEPENSEAHEYLGMALGAKGDQSGEIAEEREALRLDPGNKNASTILNEALHGKRDDLEGTLDEYNAAIYRYSSLLMVGVGFFCFIKGFLIFRDLRVFEDTLEVPIRSVAMGLNHIHGKSECEQTVPGRVSKLPCYFYEVRIERWQSDPKGGKHWAKCVTDAGGVKFYLADATGKVLVDAHGANFEVPQTGQHETSTASRGLLKAIESASWSDADREIGAYIERALPGTKPDRYRLTEITILPNRSYDVIGTCAENPRARDEHDRNLIMKGQNEKTFMISERTEKEVEQKMRKRASAYVFGGAGLAIICLVVFLVMARWI